MDSSSSYKSEATGMPNCQTNMTLFILNLVLTLEKTNSFSLCSIRRNFPSHKIGKSPKKSANNSSVKLFI